MRWRYFELFSSIFMSCFKLSHRCFILTCAGRAIYYDFIYNEFLVVAHSCYIGRRKGWIGNLVILSFV